MVPQEGIGAAEATERIQYKVVLYSNNIRDNNVLVMNGGLFNLANLQLIPSAKAWVYAGGNTPADPAVIRYNADLIKVLLRSGHTGAIEFLGIRAPGTDPSVFEATAYRTMDQVGTLLVSERVDRDKLMRLFRARVINAPSQQASDMLNGAAGAVVLNLNQ